MKTENISASLGAKKAQQRKEEGKVYAIEKHRRGKELFYCALCRGKSVCEEKEEGNLP